MLGVGWCHVARSGVSIGSIIAASRLSFIPASVCLVSPRAQRLRSSVAISMSSKRVRVYLCFLCKKREVGSKTTIMSRCSRRNAQTHACLSVGHRSFWSELLSRRARVHVSFVSRIAPTVLGSLTVHAVFRSVGPLFLRTRSILVRA